MKLTTGSFTIPPVQTPPPSQVFVMPDPVSYEFRVVEFMKDGKIDKVALQFCMHTHDQYGNIKLHGTWEGVPRIQLPL